MPSASGKLLANLVKSYKRAETDPLRPLLNAYLLERERAPVRHITPPLHLRDGIRPGGRLSPSSLCACPRQAVFKFVGMPGRRRIDPETQLIFDDGNWRHHKWQAIFHDMEAVLGPERFRVISIEGRVQIEDYYIAGSLDAHLWLRPRPQMEGFEIIVDIKGINDVGFNRITMDGAPIPHHVMQLDAYLRAMGVPMGLLWYDNKNNQQVRGFIVKYDREGWAQVKAWARSVISHLEQRRLPPKHPECSRGNLHYERCPWAHLCFHQTMTPVQLTRKTYRNFEGVREAWDAGHAAIAEFEAAREAATSRHL